MKSVLIGAAVVVAGWLVLREPKHKYCDCGQVELEYWQPHADSFFIHTRDWCSNREEGMFA